MTNQEFFELFENQAIEVKCFAYENGNAGEGEVRFGEIDAFEYEGKYFLRFYKEFMPAGYRKRYKNGGSSWSSIKEFKDKESANRYFQKAGAGYRRRSL